MEIVTTFVPGLYAFKYDGAEYNELERLFEEWNDVALLDSFFNAHEADLVYFELDIDDAIEQTIEETRKLAAWLLSLKRDPNVDLDMFFKPLNNVAYKITNLSSQKGKKRWLRLYAIKISSGTYVITGGAIKLTLTMAERSHTQKELDKLEACRNYLRANGVFDDDSFYDFQN